MLRKIVIAVSTAAAACFLQPCYGQPAQQGFQLFKQNRFTLSTPLLKQASQQAPKDKSLLYYYGVSAARSHDLDAAVLALSKIIVGTDQTNSFHNSALQYLTTIRSSLRPYSCTRQGRTYRWMTPFPIKVYVANGQQLSPPYCGRVLDRDQFRTLANAFKNPNFISSLSTQKLYKSDDQRLVLNGLHIWDWAEREKLFTIRQTSTPADADVVVFFAESFENMPARAGYTQYPWEDLEPAIIQVMLSKKVEQSDGWSQTAENVVAHEFGHALGLEHSADKSDIMYPESGADRDGEGKLLSRVIRASENDKATVRALYSMEPDGWLRAIRSGR